MTTRALRGSTLVAIAAVGVLGLAGCAGGGEEEPTASATSGAEESPEASSEPTTSQEPEETEAAAGDGALCTAEQLGSLTAASGVTIPEEAFAAATAEFRPAAAIAGQPIECVLTVEQSGQFASFAFLSGGAATLTAIAEQANAAGGAMQDVGGVITGTFDGATINGASLTQVAPDTTAFENPADVVFLGSLPAAG
ncbi:hypothetical protein GCM10009846_04700 [Agrococcus versicolor]|uniref:DUF3558 domain-containing protein n=1 Tax=Agrococcus versicolor TaxID=501482 RepID=A0ABN3AK29_9MICO